MQEVSERHLENKTYLEVYLMGDAVLFSGYFIPPMNVPTCPGPVIGAIVSIPEMPVMAD